MLKKKEGCMHGGGTQVRQDSRKTSKTGCLQLVRLPFQPHFQEKALLWQTKYSQVNA